jgi:hypothetical protein
MIERRQQQQAQEEAYNNVGCYKEMPGNGEGSGGQDVEDSSSTIQFFDAADWET